MASKLPRPPYDPELVALLKPLGIPTTFTHEMVKYIQSDPALTPIPDIAALCSKYSATHKEVSVPGPSSGEPNVTLSIFHPTAKSSSPRPCFYFIHGGGMVLGNRFMGIDFPLSVVKECNAICVTVEYRRAPKNPDPAPIEDCYAGLVWTSAHAAELGIDPSRIMVGGPSAGGGLSAGIALLCRDRKGPKLIAQFLSCPMLDDRATLQINSSSTKEPGVEEATSWLGSRFWALDLDGTMLVYMPHLEEQQICQDYHPRSSMLEAQNYFATRT